MLTKTFPLWATAQDGNRRPTGALATRRKENPISDRELTPIGKVNSFSAWAALFLGNRYTDSNGIQALRQFPSPCCPDS